jgi:AmmeMemoRadiSam system protein B
VNAEPTGRIRPAVVADAFYPGTRRALATTVTTLLDRADEPERTGRLRALIVPHAGYVYSGPIAASAYRAVDATDVRRVLLLGPSHRTPLRGLAVSSADGFATPLGIVPVDRDARDLLLQRGLATVDDRAHALEHSLEVQLPFLQAVLPGVPALPVAVGAAGPDEVDAAIDALWDDGTLVVVSSDLSHYEPYMVARRHDAATAEAITELDADGVGEWDACGRHAVRGLLVAARRRGLTAQLLDLRSSGDTAGDPERVVGYGAFAFTEAMP